MSSSFSFIYDNLIQDELRREYEENKKIERFSLRVKIVFYGHAIHIHEHLKWSLLRIVPLFSKFIRERKILAKGNEAKKKYMNIRCNEMMIRKRGVNGWRYAERVCEGMHNIILKITVVSLIISSLYCRYFYNSKNWGSWKNYAL